MSSGVCAACKRSIDAAARLCPYCGADPASGERIDTQAIMQEVFRPKTLTRSESFLEYARQRQGVVIGVSVVAVFLLLALLHSFVTARNQDAVSEAPAVPLTEIADVANQTSDVASVQLPDLDFQYEGRAQSMRTFIAEPGAIAPMAPQPPTPAAAAPARPPATATR
ncbi:MAG TPA: hypothetical protein VKB93_08785 [Thermoanaerobaculia bacterium]|nr:hypothetical protein [Thermoanaerobaculia bacterium]